MLIPGRWLKCDDGVTRPLLEADILTAKGQWMAVEMLVDIGADRTVFNAEVLASLALPFQPTIQLGGVGGATNTITVNTHLRLTIEGQSWFIVEGAFAGFTQEGALDMCVLGRDIMNLFAVIVDRPGNFVCLVGKGHHYTLSKDA